MGSGDSPGGPEPGPGGAEPGPAGGPPRVSTYLYPWDVVGDPDAASRLVSAGFRHVVLAAAYHSVRAATPRHPRHRFVLAETAALYRPARQGVWAGRRLCPLEAPWAGAEDSFAQAVRFLEAAGLRVSAWVVLTHNSALGRRQRDLVVRNCFGDSYEWALCPANEEVREYAALLSAEAVRGLALEGISLEACGQLGAEHGGHHEKSAGAYTPLASQILSICCCDACRRAWSVQGLDPGATVQALREASEIAQHEAGAGATPEDCLGAPLAAQLLACRQRHADALLEQVHGELHDSGVRPRISLHAQSDPWATGASPGLTPTSAQRAEAVLVPVDPTSARSGEVIAAARRSVPAGVKVAAYVNLLGPVEPAEFGAHAGRLIEAGPDELHLYHFGLANDKQLALFSALASMSS